ncbi:MAG: hypothetical protein IJ678_00820 [Kiritimatiellae bacterium]|nr:hypothetical protein [Kiritimatiellia bacterium]
MTALTLHAIDDDLSAALRRHAAESGESLNQTAKALLRRALGLAGPARRPLPGFMRFAGSLSAADARTMRDFVDKADFSKVDPEDWK